MDPETNPPTSLPETANNAAVTAAPSLASKAAAGFAELVSTLAAAQGMTPQEFIFGGIGLILTPIIRQEIKDAFSAFQNTAEIGKENDELQKDWDRS